MNLTDIILKLVDMSITASWIVLAVIILRFVLKKAPKWVLCLLWAVVGLRLVCPFSFESVLSLIPRAENIPQQILINNLPVSNSNVAGGNPTVLPDTVAPIGDSKETNITYIAIAWIIGMCILLLYAMVSYIKLKKRVAVSIKKEDNIYICDNIDTPFILGIFLPKIYLPSSTNEEDSLYVLAHEKAHIKRFDHLWKPIGFLLLCVYWFNPVLWVAYILLCRDIEIACDQKVINQMGEESKKLYSTALLDCSIKNKLISACPLAFGEVGVKQRIKAVLNYKKPTFWISIIAVIALIVTGVCFLTDPISKKWKSDNKGINSLVIGAECDDVEYKYILGSLNADPPYIEVQWINKTDKKICFGQEYMLYKNGTKCNLSGGYGWDALLNVVNPGGGKYEMYFLDYYGKLKEGKYRIEKEFWFQEDENTKYKAFINFTIGTQYSFVGKYYSGEKIVFDHGSFSSIFYTDGNIPSFNVTEGNFHLQTSDIRRPSYSSKIFTDMGELKKFELKKSNFDDLLSNEVWEKGYSAKALRENNLNAFSIADYERNILYYLLEQKNGEIYIAKGYTDTNTLRWIFKMKEVEKTSTEELISGESSSSSNEISGGFNPYFNATVLEIYENALLVEPFEDDEIYKSSDRIMVGTDVVSTNPVPPLKKGSIIRVVYNGEILETYPASLGKTFAIYLLGEDEEIINAQRIYEKEVSGITLLDLKNKKQLSFKEDNYFKNINRYFNTYDCVLYNEGSWAKFNPARPENYVFGVDFTDGTSVIINIFFDFYGETSTYYAAFADSDKPFDKKADYSKLKYKRYVISQDFQWFLSGLIE